MEINPRPDPSLDIVRTEARLPRWMIASALAVVVATLASGHAAFAGGFTLGTALALLSYSWLHHAARAALEASASANPSADGSPDAPRAPSPDAQGGAPKSMVFKLAIRYPLVFAAVFLFYKTRWLPLEGVMAGLFVPAAGAFIECVFQLGEAFLHRGEGLDHRRGAS